MDSEYDKSPTETERHGTKSFYEDMMAGLDELSAWTQGKPNNLRVTHVEVDDVDEDDEPSFFVLFQQGPLGWTTTVPDLPGCVATGAAQWEAEEGIMLAMAQYRKALAEKGETLPAARAYAKKVSLASESDLAAFAEEK